MDWKTEWGTATAKVIRRLTAICTLAAAIGAAACGGKPETASASQPNLVLISVDSLRADHLGCYGYERDTSPNLDRLAAEGTLFEVATSSSSWTLPAHASLFTGLPDSVHGVDRGSRKLESARRTLAEALRAAGYRTAGIWSGPLLSPRFGFGQGFDRYLSHAAEENDWQRAVDRSHQEITGPSVLERVDGLLPFLAESPKLPFFLFVHLWDVHYDYIPPAPYDHRFTESGYDGPVTGRDLVELIRLGAGHLSRADLTQLEALYDGEVSWTDHQIGSILERLTAAGLLDDAVVLVTSDHGEEFFEHGSFGHKQQLFDESIRIPLIVWSPGRVETDRRIDAPARLVDIAPTLIDLAGGEPLPSVMGRSLKPWLENTTGVSQESAATAIAELTVRPEAGHTLLAVRSRQWKILLRSDTGTPIGLWDLTKDAGEEVNLLGTAPGLLKTAIAAVEQTVAELERLRALHPLASDPDVHGILPEDLRAQLESLGYLTEPIHGDAILWAEPNPILVCDGSRLGVTTLHWKRPGTGEVELRVGGANGKLFVHGRSEGQAVTGHWVKDGLQVVLVDRAGGETLARTVVRQTTAGCAGR